uniref:Si:dkey-240h12.4 n=1 Tax=Lepisosteus oculatus TaxID=7918 RepID=W5MKK4_LEPOC
GMAVFKVENVEDLYEIGDVLGSGHFGQVRHVREKATGTPWAGKFLKIRKNATSRLGLERKAVEREVEVLQSLQHTNIMALKDVFESRAEVVLIVELISGGELFDFIAEKENLSETDAIEFMVQILKAVGFMHSKHFAHFDLKPENIMLLDKVVPHPHIKLIDFGLAQRLDEAVEFKSLCGTPQYIGVSPLLLSRHRPVLVSSRVWSVPVCQAQGSAGVQQGPVSVSVDCLSLCHKLSQGWGPCFDPGSVCLPVSRDRMTAEECLVHPWIKPLSRKQADNRSRSSINMKSFRRFNARRKWKV